MSRDITLESFVITWRELLVVIVLVLAVYIAELLLVIRSSKGSGLSVWRRGAVATQLRTLQALETEVAQLREQVAKLQSELEQVRAGQAIATPYSQAIHMAQHGLDVDEVAARCGISRGEAELIVALHRANSSA